jgi:hypothetical protein
MKNVTTVMNTILWGKLAQENVNFYPKIGHVPLSKLFLISGFWSKLSPISCCCGWNKFINSSYVFFALSNFILYAWYDVMYVYLVDYTEKDLGYSSHDATFLISIIGILNTLGEVIIGWLGDQGPML